MQETLALVMPDIVRQISDVLKMMSPMVLIVIGVILFLFAGSVKFVAKVAGAGMFIYGLMILLGYL